MLNIIILKINELDRGLKLYFLSAYLFSICKVWDIRCGVRRTAVAQIPDEQFVVVAAGSLRNIKVKMS